MALLLLRERHKSSGNWVGSDWTDRQHSKGLLGMVEGEGPKLAKSWSSVNRICAELKPSNRPCSRWQNVAPVVKGIWIYWRRSTSEIEWPVIRVMDAPQQVGGGDCGMYILKYCEFLTSNVDLAKISHDAMPFYWLKLAVQLLQGYW
ncbi:unnamed protein product [Prunus armeniaca]|uniref:Ubiquitin-like protease family profile domain-containing protein n=1 Tax=Prunus armeniaca TaxID=36596 RepID=A0A6J5TKF9_PRUAR|nr:unnamed protein product [Prunus armeniaca]